MIVLKRAYEEVLETDGYRVLVDRRLVGYQKKGQKLTSGRRS